MMWGERRSEAFIFSQYFIPLSLCIFFSGLPRWLSGKESTYQCRRHRFDPWAGKMLWRKKWQPTPVFLPGKVHGQRSLASTVYGSLKELDMTEWAQHSSSSSVGTRKGGAAAAASLQSCPTLFDPIDGSPSGSPVPGILQARTLEWVAISFSNAWKWKVKVKSLGCVRLLATPWTAAFQAPPSMRFSRQEYWSGVPLPSPKRGRETYKNKTESCHWNAWEKKRAETRLAGDPSRHICKPDLSRTLFLLELAAWEVAQKNGKRPAWEAGPMGLNPVSDLVIFWTKSVTFWWHSISCLLNEVATSD